MAKDFREWLRVKEAVSQHYMWSDEDIPTDRTQRDYMGLPKMTRPGFRTQDKNKIASHRDQVEDWLNGVTRRYGIHWVIIYGEPDATEQDDESGWNSYSQRMQKIATDKFQQLTQNWQQTHPEEKAPDPNNTIVYVKSTSRVHGLSAHQQVHNIGHAIWGHCGDIKQLAYQKLTEIVRDIQQAAHDKDPNSEPPSDSEVVLTISRLINLSSMRRVFDMKPGDFDKPAKALNQVYGSLDEFMYELIASFFRGKGWIYLKPRGELANKLEPSPAIMQHQWGKPRDWAWQELSKDKAVWDDASNQLTSIVVRALKNCVWANTGRPIYATYKTLTTEP